MKGYFETPNVSIPLNKREKGEIAKVALDQLAVFRDVAQTWPVHHQLRDNRYCNLCRICKQNLWFSSDENGVQYHTDESEILALIVAHIRQRHTDDEGNIDETSGECEVLDFPRRDNPPGVNHGNAG